MIASTEHRIFHVPEILEAILLNVPMRDLLLSRRVCTTWRSCIEYSIKLKKKLFLIADGDTFTTQDHMLDAKEEGIDLRLNPLLRGPLYELSEGRMSRRHGKVGICGAVEGYDNVWKNMLLTQPPLGYYSADMTWVGYGYRAGEVLCLSNPKGLTMGDLTCAIEEESLRVGRPRDVFDTCSIAITELCYEADAGFDQESSSSESDIEEELDIYEGDETTSDSESGFEHDSEGV